MLNLHSEKARIPAWTDRILRKGANLRQIHYNSAPLRFSDHRPVYATFQCTVNIVDEAIREALSREIYEKRRHDVGTTTANTRLEDTDDEDLLGYDPIEPGLPPASSDKRKWWLDNGKFARSDLQPPQKGAIPNPQRPSNPYTYTDEPDWVTVPRMTQDVSRSVAPPPPRRISTTGSRKLPPPYNPSAVSSLSRNLSQTNLDGSSYPRKQISTPQTNTATNNRRPSTSTTSSTSRKAPPVAKKPIHLTSASPSLTSSPVMSTTSPVSARRQDYTNSPPPQRTSQVATYSRTDTRTPPPPPQSRRTTKPMKEEESRPNLPPRPPRDLLDDDYGEINGWEALKPN